MSTNAARPRRMDMGLLVRWRLVQLRNVVDQQLREAPLRALAVLALLGLIWAALYFLLTLVLRHVRTWELVGVVAHQQIFVYFFLVLSVMLAFSNAILTFSSLYGKTEAGHLLAAPVHPRQAVSVKWLEGMLLSSWSFLLLGLPLMMAVAANTQVEWYYYPLFLGHFVGFVAIPACAGLLAAWAVAMFAPRRPMTIAVGLAVVLVGAAAVWMWNVSQHAMESDRWLQIVFYKVSFAKHPLFPSTWTAKGIVAAIERRIEDSFFYLGVVLANAAFVSWLTINILASTWSEAYNRAQQGRYSAVIRSGWLTEALCNGPFFFLPAKWRMILLKDLRAFARDPRQWMQMLIMFGLLLIYVLNLKRLHDPKLRAVITFLNLTTISLILATFTSRFIYPLLSLESQQLWLLEMLPIRRSTLLLVKFAFAVAATGAATLVVIGLAVYVLDAPPVWAVAQTLICLGVCVGLSGLSIGLGARFPVLGQRNPARIASGFGGTLNLIASMLFVIVQMAGVGTLIFRELSDPLGAGDTITASGWFLIGGLGAFSIVTAGTAVWIGSRHFTRLET